MTTNEKFRGKYNVQSNRLQGYDYSSDGAYFITICTQNHQHFFGEIIDDEMVLNDLGARALKYWQEILEHFNNVVLDEFVVMPNHVHGILFIDNKDENNFGRDAINRVSTTGGITGKNNPMLSDNLGKIVRWYKGRISFENKKINPNFAWQRNYYDRIIRNAEELNKIREYIIYNPQNWADDELY